MGETVVSAWLRERRPREARRPASDPEAPAWLARRLRMAGVGRDRRREVVVLCIGTDRSTGDALGPLVGSYLVEAGVPWQVFGTVDEPVHATNLAEVLRDLARAGGEKLVVAVDACLGRAENVGTIAVAPGPLAPGAGVHKSLPAVGDVAVTGTVNVGGFMEYLILQNTRLAVVLRLARTIADGLALAARPAEPFVASAAALAARAGAAPRALSAAGHEDGEGLWRALEAGGQVAHDFAVGVDGKVGRAVHLDGRSAAGVDLRQPDVPSGEDER